MNIGDGKTGDACINLNFVRLHLHLNAQGVPGYFVAASGEMFRMLSSSSALRLLFPAVVVHRPIQPILLVISLNVKVFDFIFQHCSKAHSEPGCCGLSCVPPGYHSSLRPRENL